MSEQKKKKGGIGKTILIASVILVAMLVYIISPIDLMPFIPFDDIAVGLGGAVAETLLIVDAVKKNKKKVD